MTAPVHVLTVCTHNRTRSVLAAALLWEHLKRLDVSSRVRSAGTMADGHPPTEATVRLLRGRGVDVSNYRSMRLLPELVEGAHLIVTAEAEHVVAIAGRWPDAYERTFTLPEVVALGARVGPRAGRPVGEWLDEINRHRRPSATYLDPGSVPEVADPTGESRRTWNTSFAELDRLTADLAELLR